jgi:2',3'-cyclic-nucleotide 2'-phosphodiesterase (5'-nucleotidase family)
VKDIDGLKVGIIGLLPSNIDPTIQKQMKNSFVEDPIKAATQTINSLTSDCDHIIALAHLDPSEIESLAKRIPEISIIIGGQDRSFVFAKKIHRSLVVQADAYGIHIGRLNLRLVKGSSEFVDTLPMNLIQNNIDQIEKKIVDTRDAKAMKNLKELLEKLIEQKNKLPETEDKNTYENFLPVLHSEIESDAEIQRMISSPRDHSKESIP